MASEMVTSSIVKVEKKSSISKNHKIYLSTGEIVHTEDAKSFIELDYHQKMNHLLRFEIDRTHKIENFHFVGKDRLSDESLSFTNDEYTPTRVPEAEIMSLFKSLRKGSRTFSQCYNRAHIWAYEVKKSFDINSMKVFLFFTTKFIREHDYRWWFHVAPATYTESHDLLTFTVLDPYFTSTPLPLNDWIHLFMPKTIKCPEINLYSEFEKNQEKESCFTMNSSMYYVQPRDLKLLEERSEERITWKKNEIKRAYRNGFGIWKNYSIE
jgi:hypothetical protein